jgi:hypothetical protein
MLGGPTVKQFWELAGQQHSIRAIARELRLSRNKYLRAPGIPRYTPRPARPSKLDAYRHHIRPARRRRRECRRVASRAARAGVHWQNTILKTYVQPLRLRRTVTATMRFETKPGEQAQVDFGRFPFLTAAGQRQWLWGSRCNSCQYMFFVPWFQRIARHHADLQGARCAACEGPRCPDRLSSNASQASVVLVVLKRSTCASPDGVWPLKSVFVVSVGAWRGGGLPHHALAHTYPDVVPNEDPALRISTGGEGERGR